jgi:hypothetical protein
VRHAHHDAQQRHAAENLRINTKLQENQQEKYSSMQELSKTLSWGS